MLENRKKIIIISAVILLIILALLFWFLGRKKSADTNINGNNNGQINQNLNLAVKLPPPDVQKAREENNYTLGLKQLAFSFAERLGSYSNHAGAQGLESLFIFTTPQMKTALNQLIADISYATSTYEGFNTRALTSDLIGVDEQKASVLVYTQRTRQAGSNDPKIFYQNVLIKFLKAGNEWKVDEATWQ